MWGVWLLVGFVVALFIRVAVMDVRRPKKEPPPPAPVDDPSETSSLALPHIAARSTTGTHEYRSEQREKVTPTQQ